MAGGLHLGRPFGLARPYDVYTEGAEMRSDTDKPCRAVLNSHGWSESERFTLGDPEPRELVLDLRRRRTSVSDRDLARWRDRVESAHGPASALPAPNPLTNTPQARPLPWNQSVLSIKERHHHER